MQLAPVQFLAPVLAVGFLTWAVGAAGGGRAWRSFGVFLLVVSVTIGGLYAAFVGIGMAMESDPAMGSTIVIGGLMGLALIGLLLSARRNPPGPSETKQQKDDDGGGGQRRPKPDLPRTPPPAPPAPAPTGPSAPWEQFDDLRKQWERVPVGTR